MRVNKKYQEPDFRALKIRKKKTVVFEAVFAEKEDSDLWENVDGCLQSFQFFERWWKNTNDKL